MDKFIQRENLRLLEKRLADPDVTEPQRKVILRLMLEGQQKSQATPQEVMIRDQAHAHSATAAAAPAAVEDVHAGALKQSLSLRSRP